MRIENHLAVLEQDGLRIAEAARRAGPDAPVPTCPGWQIRDLLRHLGGVHRWATSHVATGRPEPYTSAQETAFFTTVADDELLDWFARGHRALMDTLCTADPAISCWTFLPAPSPLAFWARRQAHETAIHRADAESALSTVPTWEPGFAVDGIDEVLNGFFARPTRRIVSENPSSIALCPTDANSAWTVFLDPTGHRTAPGRHPADLVVAGKASDLYLLVWNRISMQHLATHGDPRTWDHWQGHAKIRWS